MSLVNGENSGLRNTKKSRGAKVLKVLRLEAGKLKAERTQRKATSGLMRKASGSSGLVYISIHMCSLSFLSYFFRILSVFSLSLSRRLPVSVSTDSLRFSVSVSVSAVSVSL